MDKSIFLSGERILPRPIGRDSSFVELVKSMYAYNSGRFREACDLYALKMLEADVTVGMSIAGALSPAGLDIRCFIPMMREGWVDWIVATGANLYHGCHFSLNLPLYKGSYLFNDVELRKEGIIRIYDIVFDEEVLFKTDDFIRETIKKDEFQREMGSAEFHNLLGRHVREEEKRLGLQEAYSFPGPYSILSAAYEYGVPVFTSSPGDSSIGMVIAAEVMRGNKLRIDPSSDVTYAAAIVHEAGLRGKNSVVIVGGGSPKNFLLQTGPQISQMLYLDFRGHDYFLQMTDARPDTGGLSGATPSEGVSWGKVDPTKLPDDIVLYNDSTLVLPLLVGYLMESGKKARPLKRLYGRRQELIERLSKADRKANPDRYSYR
jgi:deoxyhypusine synthase